MTRRLFHHLGLVLVPVVYGGGVLAAAVRFLMPIPERRDAKIEVGTLEAFVQGLVKRVEFNRRLVYVLYDGESVRAYDAACTHLDCVVGWNGETRLFNCPCHGACFDRFGKVVKRPADRPLREYEVPDPATTGGKVLVLDKLKAV